MTRIKRHFSRHPHTRSTRFAAATESLERRLLLSSAVVNTTADVTHAAGSAVVSLRDAINIANKSTTPTTITFSPTAFATAKTITLNGNALELSGKQAVTITGPAAGVTVNGNNASMDFVIDKGVTSTVSGLTVSGGNNPGYGGGIVNNGALTLKGVSVTGNTSYAGGIENTGTLVITNSSVSNNNGDGIENKSGAVMTLTNVTISGNSNLFSGGIENDGIATLNSVTVSGNKATGYASVGGFNPGDDGGIGNNGKMTLIDCTVSGNSCVGGVGGGISNISNTGVGALTLIDSTVSGNTAGRSGGGLWIDPSSSSTVIQNSIIAGNQVGDGGTGPDVFGAVHSNGYNLVGKTNGSSGWKSTDLTGTVAKPLDAKLAPLANNGGPTQTMLPKAGSPAINAGDPNYNPAVAGLTDQRGFARLTDGNIIGAISRLDIGAVEVAGNIVVTAKVDDAVGSSYTAAKLSLRDAIVMANANSRASNITFASAVRGTITLNGSALTPVGNETIAGPGAGSLTISGAGRSGVFRVTAGTITISGLTLTGGNAGSGGGGALYNRGNLTLTSDTITASNASQGGGIYNAGTAMLTNCTVSGNTAANAGGGIFQVPNILGSGPATLTLNSSTVSGNSAATGGGGIFNSSGPSTVKLFNSTVAGNKSSTGAGGGIDNAGALNLTNATVSGNTAKTGGGLANTGSATANNTILSANSGGDVSGNLASTSAFNLIGTGGGLTNGKNGNQIGVTNPLLGPLANNGGPTLTMTLLAGSKAINAGSNALTVGPNGKPLATDQRGDPRIVGGRVDIGAVEV
jgi:hypothetical protein